MTSRMRTLGRYLPIIVLIVGFGVACQSKPTQHLTATECLPSGRVADAFKMTPISLDPGVAGIEWIARQASARTFSEVIDINGPCAAEIQSFRMGIFRLRSGEVFAYHPDTGVQDWESANRDAAPVLLPPTAVPYLDGWQFISATPASWRSGEEGSRARWYIGIWRNSSSWIIARFALTDGKVPTATEPLLRSSLPVNGVTYFPSVDTNDGRITIVQVVGEHKARAVSFDAPCSASAPLAQIWGCG